MNIMSQKTRGGKKKQGKPNVSKRKKLVKRKAVLMGLKTTTTKSRTLKTGN